MRPFFLPFFDQNPMKTAIFSGFHSSVYVGANRPKSACNGNPFVVQFVGLVFSFVGLIKMAGIHKLKDIQLQKLTKPGLHGDGGGLYIQVKATGAKSWIFRFMINQKARSKGLGPYPAITLAEARTKAAECRELVAKGIDPIEAENASKESVPAMTFKECAVAYIDTQKAGWKSDKHAAQWPSTLEMYAYPVIGDLPVDAVDLTHVRQILDPIWSTKTTTADRVRSRMEQVLGWAAVQGLRSTDNPARWKDLLSKIYPHKSKIQQVQHHAALPYDELQGFWKLLKAQFGHGARALMLTILTACRTTEVLKATWPEFDLDKRLWIIPGVRMKAGKEHRVPLSDAALEVLALQKFADSPFVFPGKGGKAPLSNMAMEMVLRRMKFDEITVHGFRSTFRDWGSETTDYPNEVLEMALAHAVGDKVEAAYRRGDLFQKRVSLMSDWALFVVG